jgi:two-component system OmpR family sensor kinase
MKAHSYFHKLIFAILLLIGAGFGFRRWLENLREKMESDANEQLAQEWRRFIYRLDHELKNPLTAIRVELANLEMTDDPIQREALRTNIQEQVLRLSNLVSGLRKLSKIETVKLEQLPIFMPTLLDPLIEALRDHPNALQRRLVLPDGLGKLPPILGDEDLLSLAIYNLIENAMKFTRDNDLIALRVYVEDDELVIEVEDTGQGIPPEDLPYVWEELYRSKDAHGIAGSGLGLAMVWTIADRHDGEVDIRSQLGVGTTVFMRLPVYDRDDE